MTLPTHRPFQLSIAEGTDYIYWRFDHDKPMKMVKWDVILGVCKEMMDLVWYTQFSKLSLDTKMDIVQILIKQKKEDWTFTHFEQKPTYEDMYWDDEE